MAKQAKPMSTERINMRVPKQLYNNVASLGEALGYDTVGGAARYFLTVGVQQSMAQINSGRIHSDNSKFQAVFQDMFTQMLSEASAPETSPGKRAPRGPRHGGSAAPQRSKK